LIFISNTKRDIVVQHIGAHYIFIIRFDLCNISPICLSFVTNKWYKGRVPNWMPLGFKKYKFLTSLDVFSFGLIFETLHPWKSKTTRCLLSLIRPFTGKLNIENLRSWDKTRISMSARMNVTRQWINYQPRTAKLLNPYIRDFTIQNRIPESHFLTFSLKHSDSVWFSSLYLKSFLNFAAFGFLPSNTIYTFLFKRPSKSTIFE
jgi:hypothetical protein